LFNVRTKVVNIIISDEIFCEYFSFIGVYIPILALKVVFMQDNPIRK